VSARLTIALDAMGGDKAPEMVIAGVAIARERFPDVRYLVFGDARRVEPLISKRPGLKDAIELCHTDEAVAADAKPSVALRTGRQTSMRLAIDSVVDGRAACVVSAGNTGALMAMAKIVLKTLPGIDRPAIASFFPTLRGESVMLDLGANTECSPDNLVQFAVMGSVFARQVLGLVEPTVGLLNIGSEEIKGNDTVRAAAARLKALTFPGQYYGFVEGNDITAGTVDVIVTDGFTGNIALKTAEGTAKLYTEFMRRAFQSSPLAKIGYLLARSAFRKLGKRVDPRRYNGAMFLGLRGICVKSHGGTDALGFANAVGAGVNLAINGFNERIKEEMQRLGNSTAPLESKAAAV
jgi:phosphate acyltransferase